MSAEHSSVAPPPVLVSMGDPAGIGPEIVLQALERRPEWLGHLVLAGDGFR